MPHRLGQEVNNQIMMPTLAYMVTGTFIPRNDSSICGTFVPRNVRSQEPSFPGTFVPRRDFKG